jgi:hypothetical protein
VFGSYKKKLEEERESKKKSRASIQLTHDIVIRTEERVQYLKDEGEKTNDRLAKHEMNEEEALKDIKKQIEGHTCSLSKETEAIVKTLVDRANKQNGHLAGIEEQGVDQKETLDALLNIAEGRKSLWKEIGIVVASLAAIGGLVFAGITLWH